MQEKAKEPEIRFAGFTGAWEQRKFSKLVLIERGGSPRPIDNYITNKSNGINWVKIGDAPKEGRYITKTAEKIRPEGVNKSREVFPGDLILSNSMSFGKPYIMGIRGCIHDGWLLIRDTNKIFDPIFLCYLLGTDQMLAQYKALASGSTVNNLNKELVGNTHISLPGKEEQHVIGEFLQGLDSLLTLHQRKYEKLLNIKKSMLEKMFPKEGEVVPEIRFKGFTGAWEQRKLNEIADVYDGVHQTPKYTSSGVRFLSVENIATLESEKYISEADFIRDFKIFPQKGDILMTRIGDIGTAKVIKSDEKYAFYVSLALLKPKHINSDFLCNSIASKNFQKGLKARSLLTAIPLKINKEEIGKVATSFPLNLSEQEKIGSFFNHIESLLTLHQRKLEMLKNVKQAFLEKMFV